MAKAKSKKQQMAAGAALAAKRGRRSKSSLRGASRGMAESMSEDELETMAQTKRKSLPKRKTAKKKVAKKKAAKKKTAKRAKR
jgi:hypothetical protein